MKRRQSYGQLVTEDGRRVTIHSADVARYITSLTHEIARLRTLLEQREQRPPLVVVPGRTER